MEVPPNNSDDENSPNKMLGNFKIKLKISGQQKHQNPAQIQDDDELEEGEIREDQEQEAGEVTPADNNNNSDVIKSEISSPNQEKGVIIQAGLRVCPVCRKGFNSGKALGGHMRVHAEPSPNHLKKFKIVPGRVGPNPTSSSGHRQQQVFKCDCCPKEFLSLKSLFGHMRSHPDRNWRGMNPPPELLGSGPSSPAPGPDQGPEADPSRSEIKVDWTVKRKRWQKGQSCSSSSSSEGGGQEVAAEVAATDLMLILAGGERISGVKEKGKGKIKCSANLEYDSDEVYYLKNMGYMDSDDCDTEEDEEVVEQKAAIGVELEAAEDKELMGEKRSRRRKGNRIRVSGSNQRSEDEIQGEGATSNGKSNNNNDKNNDGKWRCNTCSKTFPTHQALGGHRSSHNKEKNLGIQINHHVHTHTHIHIHTRAHVDTVEGSGLTSPGSVHGDKTFPSDQSGDLEGQHKHYVPPCEPSSSSPGQSSCQTGRRDNAIEFDLNEAPITMVEEEEEVEGDAQSHLKFFS